MDELVLPDDYPVYVDYFYVVDGVVKRSPLQGTVRDLKREYNATEVKCCNAVERGLL